MQIAFSDKVCEEVTNQSDLVAQSINLQMVMECELNFIQKKMVN